MNLIQKSISKIQDSRLRPTQIIVLGFLTAILVGSVILTLPICSSQGCWTPYIDALFTATTSVCVTGLTVVSTAHYWSGFGQAVILVLVQLGGLGVVTTVMFLMIIANKKIGLKNRRLIQESYGFESLDGMVSMVRKIVLGTFAVELAGMICFLPVLIPRFGLKGIWHSLFLGISAFCNAGMDTMGDNSLVDYVGNYWMNAVVMLLIVLGGLGFIVWWELIHLARQKRKKKMSLGQIFRRTSLHTKIVLISSAVFILLGMVVVLLCDFNNPVTLGPLSLPQKLLAALFQSVTTRTAGFLTVSQAGLSDSSSLFCMLLMLIGGSPAGTAGGVKTVTVAMLFIALYATIRGQDETRIFHRSISDANVKKGLTIIMLSLSVWFVMTILLCAVESADFMTVSYETMSAIGTVGLSKDFTSTLHMAGKLIIIIMMYLGRIGPITLATSFLSHDNGEDMMHYPNENIMIG